MTKIPTPPPEPRKALRVIQGAAEIRTREDAERPDVRYGARLWAQLSLPYRDPGDVREWVRRNGSVTLRIQPSPVSDIDGEARYGYPFGVIPRYALLWMSHEAVVTQSPELDLGDSLAEFLRKIGASTGGGANRQRVTEQLRRLFGSTMRVEDVRREGDRWGVSGQAFNIARGFDLWFNADDRAGTAPLWGSTVTLSRDYFEDVIAHPVPIDMAIARALRGSPMQLDIYVWLSHRYATLEAPVTIRWDALRKQFGSKDANVRSFRQQFRRHVAVVLEVYPAARIDVAEQGVTLYPSPPSVERRLT